jgi:hypothetical protein
LELLFFFSKSPFYYCHFLRPGPHRAAVMKSMSPFFSSIPGLLPP